VSAGDKVAPGDLLAGARSDVLDGHGTTGRRGGSVMYLYVILAAIEEGRAGEGRLKWLLAAPGTRIAPDFGDTDVDHWRLQHYESGEYVALTLEQVVAIPCAQSWALGRQRNLIRNLSERVAGRPAPKLARLVEELDTAERFLAGRRERMTDHQNRRVIIGKLLRALDEHSASTTAFTSVGSRGR